MAAENTVNCFDAYNIHSGRFVKQGLVLSGITSEMQKDLTEFFGKNPLSLVDISKEIRGSGNVTGGSVIGGKNVLQDYGNTIYSKTKEKLIRTIAEYIFKALKLRGSRYAQTAPINDIIKHLSKVIPNPNKGGSFNKKFNNSKLKQKKVIDSIVTALNMAYGHNLIDTTASYQSKMQSISEIMYSLFQGLHTEFMTVSGDVLRILKNMQGLNEFIDASYKKQKSLIDKSSDSGLIQRSNEVKSFYDKLKNELSRQMVMISNLLNVTIGPTGRNLISLLETNHEFNGTINKVKHELGTNEFGKNIAFLLNGMSSVAYAASMIEKALKKLGMSAKEFKKIKNKKDLHIRIFNHIQKKHPSTKELEKLLAAAQVIYKFDYDPKVISRKIKGGIEFGGCGCDDRDDNVTGAGGYTTRNAGGYTTRNAGGYTTRNAESCRHIGLTNH